MRSLIFLELNAVTGTSATSAKEIQVPVASSRIASVYSIFVQASSGIVAIARFTAGSIRAVIETFAPAAVADRNRFTVARTSPTNFPAPRGDPAAPFRSRAPMMTGAENVVETIPINAFSPRPPKYP